MFPALASARPAGQATPFFVPNAAPTIRLRVLSLGAGVQSTKGEVFLHRSAVPLDAADLSTPEDNGQLDMSGNECSGLCGV